MVSQNNTGALSTSLQYGFCGALSDVRAPRYLECKNTDDDDDDDDELAKPSTAIMDPQMKERKDEIDALRARVDNILNKMVQNSGDDVQRLRQKIAEIRAGPPHQKRQQTAARRWGAGTFGCPMSPALTAISKASATPSTDTELRGNLTSTSKVYSESPQENHQVEQQLDEERDEDEEIDNMAFDFEVAPLAVSKSNHMAELESTAEAEGKRTMDPPAFNSARESKSNLPDPGGDVSRCSGDDESRTDTAMFEGIARKVDAVVEKEMRQEQKQQVQKVVKAQKSAPPIPESPAIVKQSMSADMIRSQSSAVQAAQRHSQSVRPSQRYDPPATPPAKQHVPDQVVLDRSNNDPPFPVLNVSIPQKADEIGNLGISPSNSASNSSLSRPPSKEEIVLVEEVTEQIIRDPYGDKGLYTGVLVKKRPHGRGTMKYDDGRHYEGNWNHGRWHGVGRAIFANNDIFEGTYDMDQRHGHGMYQWNDGRVYTGQFFQDQRQGRGTYTWPDGAVYQGEFQAGHRHGQGMYRFADGSVYTGEWENGKYHGVGECRWADGRNYRGEWKDGRANGYGVETRPNGTIRHDGEWKDDRPIRDKK